LIDVSADPQRPQIQSQLQALKAEIQNALAHDWQTVSASKSPPTPAVLTASQWQTDLSSYQAALAAEATFLTQPAAIAWSAPQATAPLWHIDSSSPTTQVQPPGSFSLLPTGDLALHSLLPAGIHSHLLSDRDRAVLISSRFPSQGGRLFARAAGTGGARARFVVQNYPRRGTVYPKTDLTDPKPKWITWKLDYFKGDSVHVELTTEADQPVETNDTERSHFTLTDLIYLPDATDEVTPPKAPGPPPLAALLPADTPAPPTAAAVAPQPAPEVDVAGILDFMNEQRDQKLNWRTSIVDLMKLVGLESSLAERKELADELGYTGDKSDSASMNIWLHKQVIQKIRDNGGQLPTDL
jgi:hypothetical protein